MIVHSHDLGGVLHEEARGIMGGAEMAPDFGLPADEEDGEVGIGRRGLEGPLHGGLGRVVAPHRVEREGDHPCR